MTSSDEIKLLLIDRGINVIGVSETWLHANTPDGYVDIHGYTVIRCDSGQGGVVCLYVISTLNPSLITIGVPSKVVVEDVWVHIQCRKLSALPLVVYIDTLKV